MKSKLLRRFGPLAVCSALLFSSAVHAERREGPYGEGRMEKRGDDKARKKRREKMEAKLGLSTDQKARLDEHRKKTREEGRRLHELLGQKRDALRDELEKNDLDMAKIKALNAEIKDVGGQLVDHRLNSVLEVRQILTADQFKKFRELHKESGDRPEHSEHE
jgi:Spy/CpxP family protein refolding chaperone